MAGLSQEIYASTKLAYRLDEALRTDACVDAVSGKNLTAAGGGMPVIQRGINGRCRWESGFTGMHAVRASDATLRGWMEGPYSARFWVNRLPDGATNARHFFNHGITADQSIVANRHLMVCAQDGVTATLQFFWTSNAGAIVFTSSVTPLPEEGWTHVGMTKTVEADLSCTRRIYVNGVLDQTHVGIVNVGQGVGHGANGSLRIGQFDADLTTTMRCFIDDVLFDNVALTGAQMLDSYQRGLDQVVEGIPPVVTRISPGLTALTAGGAIVIDVTDADTGVQGCVVYVKFGVSGQAAAATDRGEIVHDGSRFLRPYATSSTRTAITNGYRYSIRRDGGWNRDRPPTLSVIAYDAAGNEAV